MRCIPSGEKSCKCPLGAVTWQNCSKIVYIQVTCDQVLPGHPFPPPEAPLSLGRPLELWCGRGSRGPAAVPRPPCLSPGHWSAPQLVIQCSFSSYTIRGRSIRTISSPFVGRLRHKSQKHKGASRGFPGTGPGAQSWSQGTCTFFLSTKCFN